MIPGSATGIVGYSEDCNKTKTAINDHIEILGDICWAKIAGTPSTTGLGNSGFVAGGGE
jgi:hypothetical protein